MKVRFRQAERVTVVELEGLMYFGPRDLGKLNSMAREIDIHLEGGVQAFLIDMREVKFGYTDSIGWFLEVWLSVLRTRRARVVFLLARRNERKPGFRRLLERAGVVSTSDWKHDVWRWLEDRGVINLFDDLEEAEAFLRSGTPTTYPPMP